MSAIGCVVRAIAARASTPGRASVVVVAAAVVDDPATVVEPAAPLPPGALGAVASAVVVGCGAGERRRRPLGGEPQRVRRAGPTADERDHARGQHPHPAPRRCTLDPPTLQPPPPPPDHPPPEDPISTSKIDADLHEFAPQNRTRGGVPSVRSRDTQDEVMMNRADVHHLFHSQYGVADLAQLARSGCRRAPCCARSAVGRSHPSCPGSSRSPAGTCRSLHGRAMAAQLHGGYRSFLSGTTAAALVGTSERCR